MAKKVKSSRPKARLPKGLRDSDPGEIRAVRRIISTVREVYESYGFEPLETPAFEYTDALGKFLPDQDRPNAGVFSFEDEDGQWLSLRYDLTAPLARYVAANYDALAKPFRRYQTGSVWRNEKPGPGRYREFTQFDADTVGTASVAADAELCMLASECLERIGIPAGDFVIRLNNRKLLDAILELAGLDPAAEAQRLTVLRAIDKLDRLGLDAVARLLGEGRKDDSGDFTAGAGLAPAQIDAVLQFVSAGSEGRGQTLSAISPLVEASETGRDGLAELETMDGLLTAAGVDGARVRIDPGVVRGLDYYTGPVFEAELTFEAQSEDGAMARFGSVGGGGRYDGLVERFKGVRVPATGYSVGVSRLQSALATLGRLDETGDGGPVVVLVMDREQLPAYQQMATSLRDAGVRAEMYLGESGMRAQMKYADKRRAPCVVIQGEDERARDEVMIKDLIEGSRLAETISDNTEWREGRPAQFAVPAAEMVTSVQEVLARHKPAN